jgi:branched-chain amino acid transport system permease protein
LIRSLADDGLTILLIEHNVGMVLETCDRIHVLNFGQLLATGTPSEIAANPAVIDAYLGSSQTEPEPSDDAGNATMTRSGNEENVGR